MKTATIKNSGELDARKEGQRKQETSTSVRVSPSVLMDAGCWRNFQNELGNQDDCSAESSAPALRGVHSVGVQLTCPPSTGCGVQVRTDQVTVLRKGGLLLP